MKPYLIQRAKFANNPNTTGIDSILSFDYMGSAEFEYGALPESLKRIKKNISGYFIATFDIRSDKRISIFYNNKLVKNAEEMSKIMEGLIDNKFLLKEYCDFSDWIHGKTNHRNSDFWWDVKNDYMFWKYNSKFNDKFEKLIKGENIHG